MAVAKIKELGFIKGEPVLIKGNKRKETIAMVFADNTLKDNEIRMNKVIRKNIRVRLSGKLTYYAYRIP